MANNYRLFSEILKVEGRTKREKQQRMAWCHKRLGELRLTKEGATSVAEPEDEPAQSESRADFCWRWDNEDHGVWFYAEEGGNVEHIAEFVKEYLAKFEPAKCWTLSWSDTCDRPRIGEFSGGAVFVTATDVRYMEAQNWAQQQVEAFAKAQAQPAGG